MHVKIFGALLAHVAGRDAVGGSTVGFDQGGRLRVAHFDKGHTDENSLLSVEENCSSFGFRGGSRDSVDGFTFGEYRSIMRRIGTDVGWRRIFA